MGKKTIIIKVENKQIFLNPELRIPISRTTIPIEHLLFQESLDIYWEAEMLKFNKISKRLVLKVVDYNPSDISSFKSQKSKSEISELVFTRFNWDKLEHFLEYHHKIKLDDFLEEDISIFQTNEPELKELGKAEILNLEKKEIEKVEKPKIVKHYYNFKIQIRDSKFNFGNISFKKYIKELEKEITFRVINENILAEFDTIKTFFSKVLKKKYFYAEATVITQNGEFVKSYANSSEISKINQGVIETVKRQTTFEILKKPIFTDVNKNLFTADDVYSNISDEVEKGNAFRQDEIDILKILSEKSNIRNRKQLEYLAGKLHSEKEKIRFTLNPYFGFVFLIEGEEMFHFVWELLNSHATYLWSFEKSNNDLKSNYKRLENTINTVRNSGRDTYKSSYKNGLLDDEIIFNVINHKKIKSPVIEGFAIWKNELCEKLV